MPLNTSPSDLIRSIEPDSYLNGAQDTTSFYCKNGFWNLTFLGFLFFFSLGWETKESRQRNLSFALWIRSAINSPPGMEQWEMRARRRCDQSRPPRAKKTRRGGTSQNVRSVNRTDVIRKHDWFNRPNKISEMSKGIIYGKRFLFSSFYPLYILLYTYIFILTEYLDQTV